MTSIQKKDNFCDKRIPSVTGVKEIPLIHFKQRFNWDCGISCVLMVLPLKERNEFLNNFSLVCKLEGFNKSTWTIDLCYLLHKYKIPHRYLTTTLGVHPNYHKQHFYTNILNKDEKRVNERFLRAKCYGINIEQSVISHISLVQHLTENGPIILLTNAKLLNCVLCKTNKLSNELISCLPCKPQPKYYGHYIILCGYDLRTNKFYYRNPSLNDKLCVMSFSAIDEARKCFGTDQDVILIYSK